MKTIKRLVIVLSILTFSFCSESENNAEQIDILGNVYMAERTSPGEVLKTYYTFDSENRVEKWDELFLDNQKFSDTYDRLDYIYVNGEIQIQSSVEETHFFRVNENDITLYKFYSSDSNQTISNGNLVFKRIK